MASDKNNLIVYCEFEDGKVADVSLELLTKGRQLADKLGIKLEAVVAGDNLSGIENQVFPYGVDTLYKVEDPRLYPILRSLTALSLSISSRRRSHASLSWALLLSAVTLAHASLPLSIAV